MAAIAVNVMAFLCVLEFVNMTLDWFGDRVGVDGLSFQVNFSILNLDLDCPLQELACPVTLYMYPIGTQVFELTQISTFVKPKI